MTRNSPDYTSGHSTFSGAAAAVQAGYFGTDAIAFTTQSDDAPGIVSSFPSFSAAATEAGQSRIYGGIHFQSTNQNGLKAGAKIGNFVAKHLLRGRDDDDDDHGN